MVSCLLYTSIPNRAMLEGKRVLFCDDSIVRGTQLRDNVKSLFDYGAKEVQDVYKRQSLSSTTRIRCVF